MLMAERADFPTSTLKDSGMPASISCRRRDDVLVHLGCGPRTSSDFTVRAFPAACRRAVGFQRPDLHFAEALAAELRLAAQRLLGDERVRAGRTRAWILSSTRWFSFSMCM